MDKEPFYRVSEAARRCGVEPGLLRRWLVAAGHAGGPSSDLVARAELGDCLEKQGLSMPEGLEPWPKILVVDDQSDMVRTVFWTVEAMVPEAVVRCALSGDEAVAQLAEFKPHLLVTDLRMPGEIDGYSLIDRVVKDPALAGAKILVIAGDASFEAWRRACEGGAAEFLRKPFSPEELGACVRRLLELSPAAAA